PTRDVVTGPSGSPAAPVQTVARQPVLAGTPLGRPPLSALAVPPPASDPGELLDELQHSPVATLVAPLPLPRVSRPRKHRERPLIDLANRPRTGHKFPALPTAVPGGVGDPFAKLPPDGYAAYGTGTAYHTDAALSGAKGTDIDLGFAGAAYSSTPVLARFDELGHRVAPPLKDAGGYGQGDAAEVGVLQDQAAGGGPDITTKAEAFAPPTKRPVTNDQSNINASPLLDADVLHAEAAARSAAAGCVVGSDLAYGLGSATDTKAVAFGADESTISTDGDGPPRATSQSLTRSRLVPKPGSDHFGLLTEARQTIAPTTIREGTPDEITIEAAGEWILQGMVDGAKSRLDYGPDVDSAETTVLRITRPEHPGSRNRGKTIEVARVTAQQLLGSDGVIVNITDNEEVVIGELPRGIRDDHGSFPLRTPSRIAAATDVARVRLLDQPGADLRVGHMEVAAAIPADGIACPGIGLVKSLDSTSVRPGDRFTWAIDVTNPNDCILDKVTVVDTITATPGVRYHVVSSTPKAGLTDGSVTFDGIGPLQQGQSTRLLIDAAVDDLSLPGSLHDTAVADGTCGPEPNQGSDTSAGVSNAPVPMSGRADLAGPAVGTTRVTAALPSPAAIPAPVGASTGIAPPTVIERQRLSLARTGGILGLLPASMLISGGSLLRRLRRRRPS